MWAESELAYLAGIIDGEGVIGIYRNSARNWWFKATVAVVSTDVPLVDWLRLHFGGNVYRCRAVNSPKHWKLKYQWVPSFAELDLILPAVRPFLVLKGAQADLVTEFRKTFTDKTHWKRVSPEVWEVRLRLCQEAHALNQGRK